MEIKEERETLAASWKDYAARLLERYPPPRTLLDRGKAYRPKEWKKAANAAGGAAHPAKHAMLDIASI